MWRNLCFLIIIMLRIKNPDSGVRMVREAKNDDLDGILALYLHLHEKNVPEKSQRLLETWRKILCDDNYHLIVSEEGGKIVSSCVCVIVPNLTRDARPFAVVENVVTHAAHRRKGYATQCLNFARDLAAAAGCYKIMLMTGSKERRTLDCYAGAGYDSTEKTAFIQRL